MSANGKIDIGSFHRNHGTNGALALVQNSVRPFMRRDDPQQQQKKELPEIVDVMDFLASPLPKPAPVIHGVLDKGSKLILSGGSKTRKTWSLTHLAMCIATGQSWWDFPTTRGKVLYINLEIGAPYFQERVVAIKDKLVLDGALLKGWLYVWNLRGHAADISTLVESIINRVKGRYDVVIIDPIYKVLGNRDENSNGDVASMMNELDRIVEETGAAVIFGHHFSKGNQARKDAMDRMSGAGAFARDADSLLVLTRHEQADTYSVEAILRNHKPMEPFCVTVEHPIMVRWNGADPAKLKKLNGPERKYQVYELLKVLGVQELTPKELEDQYRKATGASEGTFDKVFKEAKEKLDIEKCDGGKKWKAVNAVVSPGYYQDKMQEKLCAVVQS